MAGRTAVERSPGAAGDDPAGRPARGFSRDSEDRREAGDTPEALDRLVTLIRDGRIGQPDDIGGVAAWLASDDLDQVYGQMRFVDGDMTPHPECADGG